MATFELVLLLAVAVLLSSILDQVVPKISSPLIQIALGVIIAFLAITPVQINIDPELFLVLFIAPLLFSDAMESNKQNLWENKGVILAFAIGLVLIITLCVGFTLHAIVPSIPLAAAFALGAALGPTDAVAVASLRKEAQVDKRENSILQGECLLNDASGVVSFQFAIAAAVTGAFSLLNATETFVISFIGGIALGVLLAIAFRFISKKIYELGLDNVTFHVLFEVSMPFVVFLFCETIHVSGILGVVACGIVWSLYSETRISPYQSRLNIALSSVWKVIGFTLNGIVFVLLGMQLPMAMQSTWDDVYINNFVLLGLILLITVVIVGLRFLFSLLMVRITRDPDTNARGKLNKESVRKALIMTVGGPKGAITLSIIFSIPFLLSDGTMFPQRSLIIFIASGVILCTLLLANFLLPILAPRSEQDEEEEEEFTLTKIEILRTVIERLMLDEDTANARETKAVVERLDKRIRSMRDTVEVDQSAFNNIRIEVIDYQTAHLIEAVEHKEVDSFACFTYMRRIMQQKARLNQDKKTSHRIVAYWHTLKILFVASGRKVLSFFSKNKDENALEMRQIRILSEEYAIQFLQSLVNNPQYPSEVVAKLLIGHERTLAMLDPEKTTPGVYDRLQSLELENVQRRALTMENEEIQDYYAAGRITRAQAKAMRDNVALMMIDLEEHI